MSTEGEDVELLREYVAKQSEPAFRALVERHVDMVYATALRQVGDAHLAEEATQAVFIALAKKARGLAPSTVLAGWLFRAAQFAGAKVQRAELRRKHWEQQAAQMEPNTSDGAAAWEQMAPQLNEALNELNEPDRDALILRFFESRSMAQVGSALGTTEGAAKMRVARALEQLRGIFQARGIVLPLALLTAALSTPAAQTAPTGLAATITTSALFKSTTIPLITKGMLLLMNWNARKTAVAAIIVLLLATTTTTSVMAYLFWKQRPAPATPVVAFPDEPVLTLAADRGPATLHMTPANDGTMRIISPDGEVTVTNGVNHMVMVDAQGRTNEVTIMAFDEQTGGGRRGVVKMFRGTRDGGPAVRGQAGPGAPGAGAGIGGPYGGGAVVVDGGGAVRVKPARKPEPTPQ